MLSKQTRELIHSYFDKTINDKIRPFSFLLRFFLTKLDISMTTGM